MKYILSVLFIVFVFSGSNAQVNKFKGKTFTVIDSFSEGLAFAAILESYTDKTDYSVFNNTVGYIDTNGNWVIKLPKTLTNLYMGCYFHGDQFKNGKARMSMSEFGFDCNCSAVIEVDWKGKVKLVSGDLRDPDGKPVVVK